MENRDTLKFPPYAKLAFILLSLSIIIVLLYVGKPILFPLLLSLLFAILLRPIVFFFNKKLRFPNVLAVLVAVFLLIIFLAGIVTFISWEITAFVEDWPQMKENLLTHYDSMRQWVKEHFNISYRKQEKYIENATQDSLNGGKEMVGSTLGAFTDALLNIVLIPIYTFLIIYYRPLFIKFLCRLVPVKDHPKLQDIMKNIKVVVQSYLVGLLTEMFIVAALTTIGLSIIGVKHAVLLGTITALLNLIPYIGILCAGIIMIIASLTTSNEFSTVVAIIIMNGVVQFIDNNVLVPRIVGSKVKLNALVSLVGIIIGGSIAGIAGMFLAIPCIAILKVIFDRVESLKPWGLLMGDDMPKSYSWDQPLSDDPDTKPK